MATATATVLFCDIVRSTDHRVHLGEIEADRVFVDLEHRFRDVIDDAGGRVLKGGGDGVMAMFAAASDAVAGSVALQRCVEAESNGFELRVGVAAGDVSWERDDCFGMPVVVAARLEAECEPGQILVSAVVRHLAGDRTAVEYRGSGDRELKGVPEPVPTFEVVWSASADGARERRFPPTLQRWPDHPLVGRAAETSLLDDAWISACHGEHRLVALGGEAGAGKTRLATELARRCFRSGSLVTAGLCDRELSVPYQPWVMVLDQVVGLLPGEVLDELRADLAALTLLVPRFESLAGGAHPADAIDPEAERLRMFNSAAAVLARAAESAPLLVVIDDLHWGGSQTLDLLRHLVVSADLGRCLLLATYRDTTGEVTPPLAEALSDLRRSSRATLLSVAGISTDAVLELLGSHSDVRRRHAVKIVERTGGNPFLVTELLRDGASSADAAVPDGVVDVVGGRMARLGPDATALAEVIAVAGRVQLDVLVEVAALRQIDLAAGMRELLRSGLISELGRPVPAYQFAHALIRDAVGLRIAGLDLAQVHGALAQAIEQVHAADRRPVLSRLALHFSGAVPVVGWDKAAYYGRRAAAHARRTAAYEEAIDLIDATLEVTPAGTEERALLLIDAVDLHERCGRNPAALALAEEADEIAADIGSAALQARASIELERAAHLANSELDRSLPRLQRVLARSDRLAPEFAVRVRASLGRARWLTGDASGEELTKEALRSAREIGDMETLGHALEMACVVERDPTVALRHARELGQVTTTLGNDFQGMWAMTRETDSLIALGRLAESEVVLDGLRRRAERYRFASYLFLAEAFSHTLALAAGEFELAEAASAAADAIEGAEGLEASGTYGLQMFMIRRAQGRLDEMRPVLDLIASSGRTVGIWQPGLVLAYAELDMIDDACNCLETLMSSQWERMPRDTLWPLAIMFVSDACVILGEEQYAGQLLDALDGCSAPTVTAGYTTNGGPIDRVRSVVAELAGRPRLADRCIADAARVASSSAAPMWQAMVAASWGWMLARRGCREEAMAPLQTARGIADRLGMRGLRLEVPSPAPAPVSVPSVPPDVRSNDPRRALSGRELEVLGELALGHTNRQIAERLFISANTAANHVRAILRKTGCSNRTEAAAYAHRHGLVEPHR